MTVKVKLHKKTPCLCSKMPYLEFEEDNEILFYQDFNWWRGVPDKTKFYIDKLTDNDIWLVADGYGALTNNRFGLPHHYGNGSIAVDFKYLTPEIEAFCRKRFTASVL